MDVSEILLGKSLIKLAERLCKFAHLKMQNERLDSNTRILYTSESNLEYVLEEFNMGNISVFIHYDPILKQLNIEFPNEAKYPVFLNVYKIQDKFVILLRK